MPEKTLKNSETKRNLEGKNPENYLFSELKRHFTSLKIRVGSEKKILNQIVVIFW